MKRCLRLTCTAVLILFVLVSVLASGVRATVACEYDCMIEETCLVNPYTLGCKQIFGVWVLDYEHGVYVCVERCANPCSTDCFK